MANAQLNFDEAQLDKTSTLYGLYSRLHEGMRKANSQTPPDYISNPPTTPDGAIDYPAIERSIAENSAIQLKNSAYMMANAIISSVGDGSAGSAASADCLLRTGDAMTGALGAMYGFQAGNNNELIFETKIEPNKDKAAYVHGKLVASKGAQITGTLHINQGALAFGEHPAISYNNNTLSIAAANIALNGKVALSEGVEVGDVSITEEGIFFNNQSYYHTGNSNKNDVDWAMNNASVSGNATVQGTLTPKGRLVALGGFDLGEGAKKALYSRYNNQTNLPELYSDVDLNMSATGGVKLGGRYVVQGKAAAQGVVSFSAPNKVLNLGDSDGDAATLYIALQSDIKNYTGSKVLVGKNGDGNFPNSLTAGCGNGGATVFKTYYQNANDCGVVLLRNVRLGAVNGTIVSSGVSDREFFVSLPPSGDSTRAEFSSFSIMQANTTSLFRDKSKQTSSLRFDTDGEFFLFQKPIESKFFSVISNQYKTKLGENVLFFNDGALIEGLPDGLRATGNLQLTGNVSSERFASGFAGYGWSVRQDERAGGMEATFDSLVVRKKMRIYELEVQKQSVTNGSLWISDHCSGDLVEEIR